MKRTSFILMAFALVMTMTQCKKNEEQPIANYNVVTITLDVHKNNGSKVNVNPAMGTVDFEMSDKIYVGSGGKYVGILTHNGTNFSGNITNPTENQPLQFYFLGNVTPQETLSAGTTEECSVIISDQTEHLPVISCAASNENYVSGVTAYSAHLLNKCALVKFNVTTPSNSPICITGMHNKMTVDFANNTLIPSQDGEGIIMLPAGSGENVEKWAILLPQEAVGEGETGSVYLEDGTYLGIRPAIPAINENDYLSTGFAILVNSEVIPTPNCPTGAINGLFSIDVDRQVYFSKGNLQYRASTNTWQFANNQYDYVGSTNQYLSSDFGGWIDLFGYGTSGYNSCYPWNNSSSTNLYAYGGNISNTQYDWGVRNPISNGGNEAGLWRTLTKSEWVYLFVIRPDASEKYSIAKVNGVNGMIILPDVYSIPEGLTFIPQSSNWTNNQYSESEWQLMETAGAVFLPAAGCREFNSVSSTGVEGRYWSSTYKGNGNSYNLYFASNSLNLDSSSIYYNGLSVRLVQDY